MSELPSPTDQNAGTPHPSDPASEVQETAQPSIRGQDANDALSFLDTVKETFASSPDVYNNFLDIMKAFKNEQLDTPTMIEHIMALFTDHPILIEGFFVFLPNCYRLEGTTWYRVHSSESIAQPGPPLQHKCGLDVTDALSYIDTVKAALSDRPTVYAAFLATMKDFKEEQIGVAIVLERVRVLFAGHPNLIEGFSIFLPRGCFDSKTWFDTPSSTARFVKDVNLYNTASPVAHNCGGDSRT